MWQFLKVLHPFAPFTTDFLYQQLFVRDDSILNLFTRNIDKLPQFNNEHDEFINFMQEIITKLRH